MKSTRPSLSAIMQERTAPNEAPFEAAKTPPLFPKADKAAIRQIGVRVPAALYAKVKIKAIEQNRAVQDIITELLEGWAKR